jgi:phosphoglycerol geranylgeranyltransferase
LYQTNSSGMTRKIYQSIIERKASGNRSFAVLLDPDNIALDRVDELVSLCTGASVDYFLVGGSLVIGNKMGELIRRIKQSCSIPVILFPGSPSQVSTQADALLYLSLISGRNPELLIGAHVTSASIVKHSGLEIMPTGYMVIDGGAPTTVSYISNSAPIPHDKKDIAVCTAMAGEMLGLKLIYMDAGSGAKRAISEEMIQSVAANIDIPLIIGGGITSPEKAYLNCKAGADMIVIGNAIEKDQGLIREMSDAIHSLTTVRY